MPDQNNPFDNQNPAPDNSGVVSNPEKPEETDNKPLSFPEDTSIPPIPSGMAQDISLPNPTQTIIDAPPQEVNTPSGLPPIIPPSKPKKRFGGGKMIATILGLLVLVGSLGAGIILVKQQQDIREKAAGGDLCRANDGTCVPNNYICQATFSRFNDCGSGKKCGISCAAPTCIPRCVGNIPYTCDPYGISVEGIACTGGQTCSNGTCTSPSTPKCSPHGEKCTTSLNCPGVCEGDVNKPETWHCSDIADNCPPPPPPPICIPDGQCMTSSTACCGTSHTDTSCGYSIPIRCGSAPPPPPPPPPGATPTPTPPGETAQCLNIKAYDTNWGPLLVAHLSTLKPGDKIRFTVSGTPANKIDKARFIINGITRPETTNKAPWPDVFYDEYTIPAGTTSFRINAKLHHVTLGWF
ncbi:MAG: hypothetical protein ABIJ85_03185 [bacterium]